MTETRPPTDHEVALQSFRDFLLKYDLEPRFRKEISFIPKLIKLHQISTFLEFYLTSDGLEIKGASFNPVLIKLEPPLSVKVEYDKEGRLIFRILNIFPGNRYIVIRYDDRLPPSLFNLSIEIYGRSPGPTPDRPIISSIWSCYLHARELYINKGIHRLGILQAKILKILYFKGGSVGIDFLVDNLPEHSRASILNTIKKLRKKGLIQKDSWGWYALTPRGRDVAQYIPNMFLKP